MKYLVNTCTDAQWNMAYDQFVLEQGPWEEPVFYLWQNAPSVIIGRNQSAYAEVNLPYLEEHGIALARRVTGGGAVYHDLGNLNYSIAGPVDQMDQAPFILEKALQQLGVPARRTGRNDILVDGRKCSGYAKSLCGKRMMIHGTLLWDVDLEALTRALSVPGSKLEAAGVASVRSRVANLRSYLPSLPDILAFQDALQSLLAGADTAICLSPDQLAAIDLLATEKFRSWDWIYGHSPATTFQSRRKFACGTVEAHYTLTHGVFSALRFTGDFLGGLPAEKLAARLLGCRPDDILREDIGRYFDQVSPEEFLQLFR